MVEIYFDTATFDEIERDVKVIRGSRMMFKLLEMNIVYFKVTFESSLGVIGGTMGLLTGFSILSGVEIVFFLIKILVKCAKDGKEKLTTRRK